MALVDDNLTIQDYSDNELGTTEYEGMLNKWTNYIYGWQSRYFILKDTTLSYYKSKTEKDFGCRGSLCISKATISPHQFDECRFDITVNDCIWYLRADSPEEKHQWVNSLVINCDSDYNNRESSSKQDSTMSMIANNSCNLIKGVDFKLKIDEMEMYKEILCSQMQTMQNYFSLCRKVESLENGDLNAAIEQGKLAYVDFKAESMTFKATFAAALSGLSQCIEVIHQRENMWRQKFEREHQKVVKLEKECERLKNKLSFTRTPDHEEGPHSTIGEEEFYDAVEMGLERLEIEADLRAKLSNITLCEIPTNPGCTDSEALRNEIAKVTADQVYYANLGVDGGPWHLFAQDGELKMYTREEEENGCIVDPLKACHVVKGVTGREVCHYFFEPKYRKDWETALEQMTVVDKIDANVVVFFQVYRRVWPAAQRDVLFWSHVTHLKEANSPGDTDVWAVVNQSFEHPDYPSNANNCVRLFLKCCFYCETTITPPIRGSEIKREDITCKVTYCSIINPGGWLPPIALRAVYKREYPKFLKRFVAYVYTKTKNKPIMF